MLSNEIVLLRSIADRKKRPSKWDGALLEAMKYLATSDKGDIGEEFVYELCLLTVDKSAVRNPHSRDAYDIRVLGKTIEIKTATEDVNGCFQFNGIRYQRIYDHLLVLGVSPGAIMFNIYSSADVKTQKIGVLVPMEKGTVGSHKLTRKKEQLYDITQFGTVLQLVLSADVARRVGVVR